MRIFLTRRPAPHRQGVSGLLTAAAFASLADAFTFTSVPSADLNLADLGYTGIAGDFDGISLYQWTNQTEAAFSANGSETLMTQLPNGQFINLVSADGSIQAMCSLKGSIIVGGNFTSLGGQESVGIASFDLNTTTLSPLTGLTGSVSSLLCDEDTSTVYVGGSFSAQNSTNAIKWVENTGWTSLPFAGFNGAVTSISKASTGHVIFGGSFTGLGNTSTPSSADEQVVNLSTANITSTESSTTSGFSDPKNIICKTGGTDGSGDTWLLQDNTAGSWTADFGFGFEPSKLRLYNTHQDGRGTKTWRYTAFPINGIMNFTYVDPDTKQNMSCTSECPLSNSSSVPYQDFTFVNRVGMNAFRIDISAWYGSGGGLDGIEVFQNDIFSYAVSDFNEPTCSGASFPSNATATGPWSVHASGGSSSEYLSAQLTGTVSSSSAAVTFFPDIRQAGNYTVSLYTPGCIQDDTCTSRNQVNVTWKLSSDESTDNSIILYQTNNYDKYDVLATTQIDATSSSFRPSVVLTPADGLATTNMTIVAQRVGFALVNSTGGLNGLYEYDTSKSTVDTADFSTSAFDKLGSNFPTGSAVQALAVDGDVMFIGGNFSSDGANNVVAINTADNTTVSMSGGLDGSVIAMYSSNGTVFVGGSFNNTNSSSVSGLSNVAVYETSSNTWTALGAGVDGTVYKVAPMSINVSSSTPEEVIAFTGSFSSLLAFGSNSKVPVDGFAIWVKSQNNWIQNLNGTVPEINGILSASLINVTNGTSIYAGSISSQELQANDVATMGEDSLGGFAVKIKKRTKTATTSTRNASVKVSKRATLTNNTDSIRGAVAGAFYETGSKNITVLGGRFTATATNGSDIDNLVLIDGANGNAVSGLPTPLPSDSVVLALTIQDDALFVGGELNTTIGSSTVSGIISYDLAGASFSDPQPQPLKSNGNSSVVTTISVRPNTADVYVGGSFDSAGSLDCPGVCMYSPSSGQWSRPGLGFDGDVNAMIWTGSSTLVVAGDLKVSSDSVFMAQYDASGSSWKAFSNSSLLPGPVGALTAANQDNSQLWAAGTQNGSNTVYLMKYDGSSWQTPDITFGANTVIRSLQVFTVTASHASSSLVDANNVLMITGSINIPGFGTASSALFNGTTLTPYALTSASGNTPGSIAKIFVQKSNFFTSSSSGLAVGFVVLIALAISLGIMLLIVVAGLLLDRYRKKRDGYVPAPTSMYDRGTGMRRIPPGELLDSLSKGRGGAPHI